MVQILKEKIFPLPRGGCARDAKENGDEEILRLKT